MYVSPKQEYHPDASSTGRQIWSRWFQYLYFLRFCVAAWVLLPFVCVLDKWTGVSALSRGIMTLSTGWQAFHATFFITTLATTTLVCARNIVMNGDFRFSSQPPVRLYRWMTSCETRTLWIVLAVAQIPAVITLWYVACTTIHEQVGFKGSDARTWPYAGWHLSLWGWYAGGLVAAFAFWYLVTLFYLWTHEWIQGDGPRALIFPSLLPRLEEAMQEAGKPQLAGWLEGALRWPLRFTYIGYAPDKKGPLWELHFLATVSLIAFVLLYLFLYPIVAPVVTTNHPVAEIVFAAAICAFVLLGARKTGSYWKMEKTGVFFSLLFLALLGSFVYLLISDILHQNVRLERSFPVLASVTVILIFLQWGINGASFFFDRYRVPVLTSAVAIIFLPKLALSYVSPSYGGSLTQWVETHIVDWDADHYFEARTIPQVTVLPTPTDAVDDTSARLKGVEPLSTGDEPLVVVTATGGGIQAAEWTAQVMARLEKEFRIDRKKQLNGYLLHNHVLLASGVSGGSVGLVPYLLEYTAPQGTAFSANEDLRNRLTIGPGCSSLEAVAWGLEYYDLQRLALTFRFPVLQSAQDSPEDMGTIVAPDRTWALSRALNRNLNDPQCGVSPGTPKVPDGEQITLAQAAKRLINGTMPAFTLNTTVAESGGRFLLSNYMVPSATTTVPSNTEFLPAESFLQAYAQDPCCANGPHGEKLYADLPLSTASRLSATFPVVSSATRIPRQYAKAASHFLDGGYFDNDGTGSAIEFLYSVMEKRVADQPQGESGHQPPLTAKPLKVLLVEIRDGNDLDPHVDPDDLQHQSDGNPPPAAWWTLDQLLGPLEGLWNAGHVSVTRRNRRELCVLETAYRDQLVIHHVVFAIPQQLDDQQKPKPAPLSWKLTASQLAYISSVVHGDRSAATDQSVRDAMGWVAKAETSTPSSEVCSVANAPTQ
ncbi:MAG TPA: hypothetical protein VHX37_07810 [Acidobacteriaceae bacterium]|jgi:hypothetical protein|nr:hypothetical protein [Acidobacteriaceae bacterium]